MFYLIMDGFSLITDGLTSHLLFFANHLPDHRFNNST